MDGERLITAAPNNAINNRRAGPSASNIADSTCVSEFQQNQPIVILYAGRSQTIGGGGNSTSDTPNLKLGPGPGPAGLRCRISWMDAGINFRRASKLSRPASHEHGREIVIAEWAQKREPTLKQIEGGD